jgi:RNA polymerase sigma-70 factor, ECF subfamily
MADAPRRRISSLSALPSEGLAAPEDPIAVADVEQLRLDIARAVRSVCPRWLADQADDLAQIAMCRLLDRVRTTEGTIEITSGYLYRTAYSVVIDEIRRRRRLRELPLEPDVSAQSHEGNPERQTFSREVREAVTGCLARLATSRRRAVTLHLMGHSLDEISALLECRYKQTENLVYRGLGDLRACLRKHGVQR